MFGRQSANLTKRAHDIVCYYLHVLCSQIGNVNPHLYYHIDDVYIIVICTTGYLYLYVSHSHISATLSYYHSNKNTRLTGFLLLFHC